MNAPFPDPLESSTTQAAEGLPRRRWRVSEIDAMVRAGIIAEDERFELIGGEAVPLGPKGLAHERLRVAVSRFWIRALPEAVSVIPSTTFRVSADTFLEPDLVFYRTADGLDRLDASTALLVVEVAEGDLGYDLHRKSRLYALHGVREVWVIDADTLVTHVRADPGPDGYRMERAVARDVPLVLPFAPDVAVALQDLRLV